MNKSFCQCANPNCTCAEVPDPIKQPNKTYGYVASRLWETATRLKTAKWALKDMLDGKKYEPDTIFYIFNDLSESAHLAYRLAHLSEYLTIKGRKEPISAKESLKYFDEGAKRIRESSSKLKLDLKKARAKH